MPGLFDCVSGKTLQEHPPSLSRLHADIIHSTAPSRASSTALRPETALKKRPRWPKTCPATH
eukprot:5619219-Pyramimonas_sp.AAC.1